MVGSHFLRPLVGLDGGHSSSSVHLLYNYRITIFSGSSDFIMVNSLVVWNIPDIVVMHECSSFFMMMSPADEMSLQGAFLLHTPQRWVRINDMSPCCNYKADPVARLGGDGYQSKFLSRENCLQFPFINEGDGTVLMWIWCKSAFELRASHRECTQARAFDYLS